MERARLRALLADGGALVVRGEPGVGKSTLLEHAVADAGELQVLRATGVESESELAYAGLHALLHPVLGLLDRLPEPHADALACAFGLRAGRVEDRFLVSLATQGLLGLAAGEAGVLCVVDDAQWLDRASADAIVFSGRRLEPGGVALLVASRERVAGGLPELVVRGLEAGAAAELLGETIAPAVRDRLVAATGGNPLALLELPRVLTAEQLAGREPLADPLPVGEEVERVFLAAVRRLGPDAQALALLVAADDTQDRATIARAAVEAGTDPDALDELEATGLVRIEGMRVALRHPLVRSAVYGAAGSGARRRAHLALAAVLDGERRTWHRAAAADGPDPVLAAELEAFATDARHRSAYAAAAAALERAALLTTEPAERAHRLAAAAECNWDAGRVERVEPLLDQALPLLGPEERASLGLLRGDLALELGRPAEAFELFVDAAGGLGRRDPTFALEMLARAAEATWWLGETGMAAELHHVGAQVAPTSDPGATLLLHLLRGAARVLDHDFDAGVADLRVALHAAGEAGSRFGIAAGFAAVHAGLPVEGHAWFARVVTRLQTEGRLRELPFALSQLATMEVWLGNVQRAGALVEEALRLAVTTGQERSARHASVTLAIVEAVRGREDAARAAAASAVEGPIGGVALQASRAAWALGRLELGLGRPAEALAHLEAVQHGGKGVSHPLVRLTSSVDLVEAAARAGRPETAHAATEVFAGWARASGSDWTRSALERMRGMLAEGDDAATHFEASLQAIGDRFPFDGARTRLVYGEWLRRSRRRADAREQLRAAHAVFEALGAHPWADRARLELRATGEAGPRGLSGALDELTPQELGIARLVADGATNKEIAAQLFLSVRTIEYHLHKVFTKLGIASRHALARLVHEDDARREPALTP